MGDENKKAIDLELLNYYDSKIRAWTTGNILEKISSLEADKLKADFRILDLDDGDYKVNAPIKCSFNDNDSIVFDGVDSVINIMSDSNYKYYIIRETKGNGNIAFYYGFTDKANGTGKNSTFNFQSILEDILQLQSDIIIEDESITTGKLANGSVTEEKILDKSVTAGKLSDDVKSKFDAKGSADAALESAKIYTDNALSWGKF